MRYRHTLATLTVVAALTIAGLAIGVTRRTAPHMGKQPDGSFLVSSGQRVEGDAIAFTGRPSDLALHPTDDVFAVLSQHEVFICTPKGILARSHTPLGDASAGFHGILWTNDHRGSDWWPKAIRFVASTDQNYLLQYSYSDLQLDPQGKILLTREGDKRNAWPGGMCLTHDNKTLYVAAVGLDAVVQVDIAAQKRVRDFPTQSLPYEVKLSPDEKTLIVSNWGGRKPLANDATAKSGDEPIVIDGRGAPASGTVSLIDRATGETTHLDVGIHPTAIVTVPRSTTANPSAPTTGDLAYVANAMSDTISEIDLAQKRVTRTFALHAGHLGHTLGEMPNAMAVKGDILYVCCGGDNALCEIDRRTGTVRGYRHAGYFPAAMQLSHDGRYAYVLNSKGNGSVANTLVGNPGSPHDFQGTLSVIDLTKDLRQETQLVAHNNHWDVDPERDRPHLAVYQGAIKHVLYIIKENQTYDSIYGDMPEGNGAPKLCVIGEKVMPNHRALARQFTLFDNGYVSGTNSADGHAWSTQSIANDYMEHFYVSYRTYPDGGDCSMSLSNGGCLWDAVAAKHKRVRVYGEYCAEDLAEYKPYKPKNWFEAWEDRQNGKHKFTYTGHTLVAGLKPYLCPSVHYWPLIQSDQARADEFLKEYQQYSASNTVPDLMIICLPCDHTEGMNPDYPTGRAMQADNDLALGRVVEDISHSPQWKDTCIFVIEDDGQALPDHVDGHRVPYMVISPYTKRHAVDSHFYTTASMLRSIGLILHLDPMTRFDALADPITTCFTETPDLTPYTHVANNVPLDEHNPPPTQASAQDRYWQKKSLALDWSHIDAADPYWLSRINWYSLTSGTRPFPITPGQATIRNGESAIALGTKRDADD
jgi:DNA-binding beta-propeller fold protein YncE